MKHALEIRDMHAWLWCEKLKKETTLRSKLRQEDNIKPDIK